MSWQSRIFQEKDIFKNVDANILLNRVDVKRGDSGQLGDVVGSWL